MRRARDRARRAAKTAEKRDARLRQIHDNPRKSLATESEEERAVRLQQMRDRLGSETEEERAARLQRMSANQRHRLASETATKASMGCYYPQGTRPYTRQSGN